MSAFGGPGAPYPNPLLPGFNPDPSIVVVDGVFYIVTSTFEYLPGLPIYRSTDFITWEHIGNVASRPAQLAVDSVPTGLGAWAPTIRYRDGLFYVIVTVPAGRGAVVFTATDPAGEWSDGVTFDDLNGIDPDLAWDDAGNAYVTFSGFILRGPNLGQHLGIQQVRVDLETGALLEEPRSLWSGSGFMFPEAPHLYHRGSYWYLMVAEGGTERGHGVSIARGPSPEGPFEAAPSNPFLTARSTDRAIQNTGHGDLVKGPDGETLMVLLGVRPGGITRAFSPLGRETFVTRVDWVDDWPVAEAVELAPTTPVVDDVLFDSPLDPGWIAVRRLPETVASVDTSAKTLSLSADSSTLDDPSPAFIGRRQLSATWTTSAVIDITSGTGGIAVRYDEQTHAGIQASLSRNGDVVVVAHISLPTIRQEWSSTLPPGRVTLHLDSAPPTASGFSPEQMTSDFITLWADTGESSVTLAHLDGRFLTSESSASFTGRVLGLYCTDGTAVFYSFDAAGTDNPPKHLGS